MAVKHSYLYQPVVVNQKIRTEDVFSSGFLLDPQTVLVDLEPKIVKKIDEGGKSTKVGIDKGGNRRRWESLLYGQLTSVTNKLKNSLYI